MTKPKAALIPSNRNSKASPANQHAFKRLAKQAKAARRPKGGSNGR